MNRRAFFIGTIFLTTGCVTNGFTSTNKITGENLTKSRELKYGANKDNNLPRASFKSDENEVTITTVIGVAACNKAVIKESTYDSEASTLSITFDDKRRDDISSDAGCAGAVAQDVYTATITLQNNTSPRRVIVESDGNETTIDDISAEDS